MRYSTKKQFSRDIEKKINKYIFKVRPTLQLKWRAKRKIAKGYSKVKGRNKGNGRSVK